MGSNLESSESNAYTFTVLSADPVMNRPAPHHATEAHRFLCAAIGGIRFFPAATENAPTDPSAPAVNTTSESDSATPGATARMPLHLVAWRGAVTAHA